MSTTQRPPVSAQWREHPLFAGLSRHELDAVQRSMEELSFRDGETIIAEGDEATSLYILVQGTVSVLRAADAFEHEVGLMSAGELFGEIGLFSDRPRSATVRAIGDVIVLRQPYDAFGESSGERPRLDARAIGDYLSSRFAKLSNDNVSLLQSRLSMAQFFVGLVCSIAFYTIALSVMTTHASATKAHMPLISLLLLFTWAVASWIQIRRMGWDVRDFGLHLRGARRSFAEAVLWTGVVLLALTAVKWLVIEFHPAFAGEPLIGLQNRIDTLGPARLIGLAASYAVFAPIQEFIARGVVQTSLQRFLTARHPTLWAILISNLLFAVTHLHVSYLLVALAFVSGLFWGWMYSRHQTLVGVSFSHVVIGLYSIYVLSSTPV